MAVPHVSPVNFARVRTFAQIELGGSYPPVEDLSFNDQLAVLIGNTGGYAEPLSVFEEVLEMENPVHPAWADSVDVVYSRDKVRSMTDSGRRRREEKREEIAESLISMSDAELARRAYRRAKDEPTEKEPVEESEETVTVEDLDEVFDGKRLKNQPEFQYEVPERNRAHRPEVEEELVKALEVAVENLRPRVPVDAFDFDAVLSVFLDELEERYSEVAIEVERAQKN